MHFSWYNNWIDCVAKLTDCKGLSKQIAALIYIKHDDYLITFQAEPHWLLRETSAGKQKSTL